MALKQIQYQIGFKISKNKKIDHKTFFFKDVLYYFLQKEGFDLSSLVEEEDKKFFCLSFYVYSKKESLVLINKIKKFSFKGVRFIYKKHLKKDWESSWKKGWKPFPITKSLQVIPLWQQQRLCEKNKKPIYLETTNAFGTGLHETTRFTAQMIEDLNNQFKTFLDVGTGSGILMIVAFLNGAKKCVGFDIDANAVKVAKDNLKANNFKAQIKECSVEKFIVQKQFDLVAANLVSLDLIDLKKHIISFVKKEGFLILSGISLKNICRVKKAFCSSSLKLIRVVKGKEWSAMLFNVV